MKSELSEVEFEDFPSICRICLHRGDVKPFIQTLQDLFSSLVKEITEDDELPKNLCDKCCEKLEEIQEFITNSVISDEYLRDVLWKHKNGFNVESFEDDTKFEITTDSTPDVENDMHLLKDEYSDNEITEENEYAEGTEDESIISDDKELEEIDEIDNYEFHCKVCKNIFISSEDLEDHKKNHSECLEEKKKNEYKCNICNKIISTRAGLKRHAVCHTNETPYECPHCDRKFKFQQNLNRHDKIVHKGLRPFKCDICGKEFATKNTLTDHKNDHHELKVFHCKYCDATFGNRLIYSDHLQQHALLNETIPSKCKMCSRVYSSRQTLRYHEKSHVDVDSFLCYTCGKGFKRKTNLILHLRSHTGEKPYACKLCDKSFTMQSALAMHVTIHTGVRAYKCKHCKLSFKQSSTLNKHMKLHIGERDMKCSYCNKSFFSKSNLQVHTRTHTGERPYSCQFCSKKFTDPSNLKRHLQTHDPIPPQL